MRPASDDEMDHESQSEREHRRVRERDLMREAILTQMIMKELEEGLTEAAIQTDLLAGPIPALLRLTPNEITPFISAIARSYRNNTPEQWAREKARVEFLAGPVMQVMRDGREMEAQARDQATD